MQERVPVTAHSLDSVQAKIDRAQEHLNVLDGHVLAYLGNEPYRFVAEEHTEGSYHHFAIFLEVDEFPPDELWGPVIGDVVHNLRSALDHLAWQVALPSARVESPRRIEYPIFLDHPRRDPEVRGTFTKKVGYLRPEAHAVVHRTQPYKAGDSHHPLWLLQALWNMDKHRVLHTAGFLFGTPFANDYGYGSWIHGPFGRVGDTKNRTPLSSGYGLVPQDVQNRVDTYKNMTVDVSLGHGLSEPSPDEPYAGLPIRQILRTIQRYVEDEVVAPIRLAVPLD